jgi:outer membrane protein assembly factor BamA
VKIENPVKDVSAGSLLGLVQQKPNSKFTGLFPLKLLWNSIFKNSGEQPVILDLSQVDESKEQMRKYLDNIGYFGTEINHSIHYKKKKAKKVTYEVKLATPYRIRQINYTIKDDSIVKLIDDHFGSTLLRSSFILNSNNLDKERTRLTQILNNNGYFGFTRDYIYYEVDSALNNKQADVTLIIKNASIPSDDPALPAIEENHKIYYINDVFIQPNFRSFQSDTIRYDTIVKTLERRGDPILNKYNIVYKPPLKIKPKVITRSMFVENDNKFNATDARQSYKKLNELQILKYVNINFREAKDLPKAKEENKNYLDCIVQVTRNPVHSYSIEAQGTNSGGDLGIGGYLVYQNKNLFRGGEVFYLRLKGAMEAQEGGATPEEVKDRKFLFFNTFEAGIEANLYIPKFLAPINQDVFSRYFRPKTNINLGYNWQDRLEYERIITNISFGYEWSETQFRSHILFPIDVNVVKVTTTPEFDSILAGESERFRNQYTDHLILGLRYSYIFNNQELNRIKDFTYLRWNIETSGNLLNLVANMTGAQKNDEGFQTIFGIRYSQYVKSDVDIRHYFVFVKKHTIAVRMAFGLAIPYGNSIDIPFEKGFYGGGANGMRAWILRYLGPGAYPNLNNNIERVGDVKIEGNIEYRFPVFKVFKGAFFYDIGNIWLLSENETFPGGKFKFKNFFSELAMDVGIGLRLDFKYFIFRVDIAQRMMDPARTKGERWVIGNYENWFNPVYNLGIGYPF